MEKNKQAILSLLQGTYVRVYPGLVKAVDGNGNYAIYLSQLWFWTTCDQNKSKDGWFHFTSGEATKRTGLSRKAQEGARKYLKDKGILQEEHRPSSTWVYFKLDMDALYEMIVPSGDNVPCGHNGVVPSGDNDCTLRVHDKEDQRGTVKDNIVETSSQAQRGASFRPTVFTTGIYHAGKSSEWFVAGILEKYPINGSGTKPSKEIVERLVDKLAKLPYKYTEQHVKQACDNLDAFRAATKNYAQAVAAGKVNKEFVLSFESFSGINRPHTFVPKYLEWVTWQMPKRELVV